MLKKLMSTVLLIVLLFGTIDTAYARIGDSGYEEEFPRSGTREDHF